MQNSRLGFASENSTILDMGFFVNMRQEACAITSYSTYVGQLYFGLCSFSMELIGFIICCRYHLHLYIHISSADETIYSSTDSVEGSRVSSDSAGSRGSGSSSRARRNSFSRGSEDSGGSR